MTAPAGAGSGRPPARTVFFGSGAFGVPILDAVAAHPQVELVAVIGQPDRPVGRRGLPQPTPVVAEARRRGLEVLQPARFRAPETVDEIAALQPELGVLADFGRIVPRAILDLPSRGILNVHPSLLPRHRGATPVAATILAGDREAGVSIMRMDEGLDTGPVVASRRWPLADDATATQLTARAAEAGAALLAEILAEYLAGELAAVPQDEAAATLTRPHRRTDGLLDPTLSAAELERRVRALEPWPGTFIETAAGRLAVLRVAIDPDRAGDVPGSLLPDGAGVALATSDGRLRLLEVQPAGGRPMSGAAWVRGHRRAIEAVPAAHG